MKWDALGEASKALYFSYLGILFAACIAIGALSGYYLDKWLGTKPWLFLAFLLLGIVSGFINVIREVLKEARKEEREDKEKRKKAEEEEYKE